jgi:wobble nucleotide-excising tRNase
MYASADESATDDDAVFFDAEEESISDTLRQVAESRALTTASTSSSSSWSTPELTPEVLHCLQVLDDEVKQLRALMDREQLQVHNIESRIGDMTEQQGSVIERLALRYEENARQTYATYVRRLNQLLTRAQGEDDDTSNTSKKIVSIEHRLTLLEQRVQQQDEALQTAHAQHQTDRHVLVASAVALAAIALFAFFKSRQTD